jgi:hypothetical protein
MKPKLIRGKRYRVTLKAPKTGPYKGFARKPFEGEYHGEAFIGGHRFWDRGWHSAYSDEIESFQEIA